MSSQQGTPTVIAIPTRNALPSGTNPANDLASAAAEAIRIREERLHVALSASGTGTFRWDPDSGAFLDFDENLRLLVGLHAEAKVADSAALVRQVHADDAGKLAAALDACRCRGTDFELEFQVASDRPRWLFGRGKMVREQGRPAYLVGACTDITGRKQAEEALRHSEKRAEAGRLAASIAHEINNPLAAITNLLWLAQQDAALTPRARGFLDAAQEELRRVARITKQTLGFYRDSSLPRPLAVEDLVAGLLGIFAGRIRSRNLSVQTEVRTRRAIVGQDGELRQMLSNILANSLDAVGENGRIRIRISCRGNLVRITVADNGCGIAPADLSRVADPFFTTKQDAGTGLGLWVARQVVEKYRGTLQIRSRCARGAGRGTAVSVCLPAPARAEAAV